MAPSDGDEKTSVDLGDDLLEKTAVFVRESGLGASPNPPSPSPAPASETLNDQLQSAQILLGEGLIEEGKKVLRRILRIDPRHVVAKQTLDAVQEQELQGLFQTEPARRRPRPLGSQESQSTPYGDLDDIDPEKVLKDLERDLNLESASGVSELSLFQDAEQMNAFVASLDGHFPSDHARDRVDLGIGFLEMGLYEIAARQFKSALPNLDESERIWTISLQAYALILADKAFDATLLIEAVLGGGDAPEDLKIDFYYLMGRAQEKLGAPLVALQWYGQVKELDPLYRDTGERIFRLSKA